MTDKQIIIDDQKKTIHRLQDECTKKTNAIIALGEKLEAKEQECEELKKKLKPKLKNAHCAYFDGQTGWCKAKEFIRCNPIGCKLYTIDELSTIVDLQQQLDQLKAENEELKKYKKVVDKLAGMQVILTNEEKMPMLYENAKDLKLKQLSKTLAEIKEIAKNAYDEFGNDVYGISPKQILQKISEVENAR